MLYGVVGTEKLLCCHHSLSYCPGNKQAPSCLEEMTFHFALVTAPCSVALILSMCLHMLSCVHPHQRRIVNEAEHL